jgi:hypothetical protein
MKGHQAHAMCRLLHSELPQGSRQTMTNGNAGAEEQQKEGLLTALARRVRFDSGKNFRSQDAQSVTDTEEDVHGGGFVVVFQLADVGTVNPCRKRKLFLRQIGFIACLTEFLPQRHAPKVIATRLNVC